jgi:hypothetical protein
MYYEETVKELAKCNSREIAVLTRQRRRQAEGPISPDAVAT